MTVKVDEMVDSRPKGIPLREIVEMRLQGLSGSAIARHFGISRQAVSKRLKGLMGRLDGDRLDAYRKHRVAMMESLEERLLSELVNPARVKKATLGNVAYAFTQVHQARRLEAGESTANLSLAAVVAAARADRLKKSSSALSSDDNEQT